MLNMLFGKTTHKVATLIASVLLISGCGQNKKDLAIRPSYESLCQMIKDINVADGVDQNEAEVLARAYYVLFWKYDYYPGTEGNVGHPDDRIDYWYVPVVRYEVALRQVGTITIDKKTTEMSAPGYPTIENPIKYFCSKM
jgi:hypothetical protein